MDQSYLFGILTVSDRCYQQESKDESGPGLKNLIEECGKFKSTSIVLKCVPDEISIIEETLKEWADVQKFDAVFTTGGTGFAPRDVTPEATRNVIEKEASSIPAAILFNSLSKTKMAMLSRAVCGIRKRCLIINLPGSKKAVSECFSIIVDCIPHALALLRDDLSSVSATHRHVHSTSKSKVDVTKVARRARQSTFPMISVEESLSLINDVVEKIKSSASFERKFIEEVNIQDALGRVLVAPAAAQISLPPYRASVKDGYAAVSSDGVGPRTVVSSLIAGSEPVSAEGLRRGECVRVNTGGPVPTGADCVVQVEDTRVLEEAEGGAEERLIQVMVPPTPGQDIREVGSDVRRGEMVVECNKSPLTSSQISLLAAVGVFKVPVVRNPRVAVISTGNELQLPGRPLGPGQIYDSNKLLLLSLFKTCGFPCADLGIARDEPDETLGKLREAVAAADVVVTTGSVSMGERDLLKLILKEDLNATIHFGRVNLKPGKPTTFATCPGSDGRTVLLFCLPGNPVSAVVTSHLYVLPTLRRLAGWQSDHKIVKAQIQSDQKLDSRVEFKRGILQLGGPHSPTAVQLVGGHMLSSNLLSVSTANCLVHLPEKTEKESMIEKNSWVDCWLTGEL